MAAEKSAIQNCEPKTPKDEAIWLGGLLYAGDQSFHTLYSDYVTKNQKDPTFADFWREFQHIAKDDMETTPDGKVKVIEWKVAESEVFARFEEGKMSAADVTKRLSAFDHKYSARIIHAFNDDAETDNLQYRLNEDPSTDTMIVVKLGETKALSAAPIVPQVKTR